MTRSLDDARAREPSGPRSTVMWAAPSLDPLYITSHSHSSDAVAAARNTHITLRLVWRRGGAWENASTGAGVIVTLHSLWQAVVTMLVDAGCVDAG